jgi:glutamyl-tRNA synthetase
MPQWAHLPLIMGPDGAKLSKRHGNKYGFPIFAMNWQDRHTQEMTEGFRERGFLPEAFINLLALMGWNDGTDQEIFSLDELCVRFSMDRVHSAGAQFDFEKAKWFNHEWMKRAPAARLLPEVKKLFMQAGVSELDDDRLLRIVELVKERCTLLPDFIDQALYFYQFPDKVDTDSIKPKWSAEKNLFFVELLRSYELTAWWDAETLENGFRQMASVHKLKPGDLMLPLRVMLVGGKFGPAVFQVAGLLGKEESLRRMERVLALLEKE